MKRLITYILIVMVLFTSTTLMGFASGDLENQNIEVLEIISPSEDVIYSNNLLISVKVPNEKSFRFTLYADDTIEGIENIKVNTMISSGAITVTESTEKKELADNVIVYGSVEVTTTGDFSFYTLQLEELIPGEYQIMIEEFGNSNDSVNFTILKSFEIKDESERPEDQPNPEIFKDEKTKGILENLIKSIFGD